MDRECRIMVIVFSILACLLFPEQLCSQDRTPPVIAAFSNPDTVCLGEEVHVTNLSQGGSTWFWKFCQGDPLTDMRGTNLGNPSGYLQVPSGVSLVRDGVNYYAFVTNAGNGTITKFSWGNSLMNPVTAENLGNFGVLTGDVFGIQVKFDQGYWYGFVTNGNQLVRLNFGSTLSVDVPSAKVVATSPLLNKARGLVIGWDGSNWTGFCTNYPANTLVRFNWGSTLSPNPTVEDLGNTGNLDDPMQPALISDNSGWYLYIANTTSLVQLSFGNSLLNAPVAMNLGNMSWMTDDRGISLFTQCNRPYGFITNHNVVENLILQINFPGGIAGSKSITPLGSVANLYLPTGLSESLNSGDTIFTMVLNESSATMLWFPPCSVSPIPESTLFDPSPLVFTQPGKYTINLTVDRGLATEQTVCNEIFVDDTPPVRLGNDTVICDGTTIWLDAGSGFNSYSWNTGQVSQSIPVDTSGSWSVIASKASGCISSDTITIGISQPKASVTDTSICYGERYFAGGKWQFSSGTFYDTLSTSFHCDSIVTTHLEVREAVIPDLGEDTCIYTGTFFLLQPRVPGAMQYLWQDGSADSVYHAREPGKYWVKVTIDQCSGSDTIRVNPCPVFISFPDAFTPDGDGLNDSFRPVGTDIGAFQMVIFDRWGRQVFETSNPGTGWNGQVNGKPAETGVYTYVAVYEIDSSTGESRKVTGTVTLVR